MKQSVMLFVFHGALAEGKVSGEVLMSELSRAGIGAVEPMFRFQDDDEPKRWEGLRKAADGVGMAYSCVDIGVNLIGEAEAERRAGLDIVKRGVEIAASLACPTVLVAGSRPAEGMTNEDGRKVLADVLARAAQQAEGTGVTITIEDFGVYPEFTCASAHVLEVLELSGRPDLKATFDNGNFLFADEKPSECFALLGDRTVHVHIKDFVAGAASEPGGLRSLAGTRWVGCDIGEGDAEVAECLGELKARRYGGWLSLEVGTSPALDGALIGARYVREAWESA